MLARSETIGSGNNLAKSFKSKTTGKMRRKKHWIDEKVGPSNRRVKGRSTKGRNMTYAPIASMINKGSEQRTRTSGGRTGKIKATNFIDRAWNLTKTQMLAQFRVELFRIARLAIKKSGFIGPRMR